VTRTGDDQFLRDDLVQLSSLPSVSKIADILQEIVMSGRRGEKELGLAW
jgi:hypothetical protein